MTCGRSARISRGPSDSAIDTNPASTVSAQAGVSRGSSACISVSATAALPTGTRAASTASASSWLSGLATAAATRTSAAAPPARYERPHWRTHPADDAASEALTSPRVSP
jgi:hypothetical protein